MRTKLRGKFTLLFVTCAVLLAIPAVVLAAELLSAEVRGAPNNVTVVQGKTETFNVDLSATGNLNNTVTQTNPATAKVNNSYSITKASAANADTTKRVVPGSTFSAAQNFWSDGSKENQSPATWANAPTALSVPASISVASDVPVGTYTINLSQANSTVQITNPDTKGASLEDKTATTLTFEVVAPPPPSDITAPVITPHIQGSLTDSGWYTSDVGLSWTVVDNESAISSKSGCDNVSITTDQNATTYKCTATSGGGTSSKEVTIKRDATAPTNIQFVDGPAAGSSHPFGNVPNEPTCTATDATSTMDSCVVSGYSNAVGDHTLTATATDKAGNRATATRTYTVTKAPAQVNLSDLTQTYNGSPRAATVTTVPANLNVDVTYDGNAQAPTNAGSYAVVATVNNANYQGSAEGTLSIARADQAISFGALADKTFGDANFNVSATGGNSGEPVTFTTTAGGNCSVVGNTVQITGAGSCTITASQAGNANYNAAPSVERAFAIAKAQATINLNQASLSKTYNGSPQGVAVNTTPADLSGVNVTYDGNAQAPTNAGSYAVVASLNNSNYRATDVTGTLVIDKAQAQVSLSNLSHTYDGTVKAASASTTPTGLNVDLAYSQDGSAATPRNAGSYAVVATVNNANYEGQATGTLVIQKAQAELSFGDGTLSKVYTGSPQGVAVNTTPDVPNRQLTVTYNGSEQAPTNAGSYNVVASLNDANYKATDLTGTLVIAKAQATLSASGLDQVYNGNPRAVTVTTTPASLNGVSITYEGNAQAPTNAGSYNVVASLNNPNYRAQDFQGVLNIAKAQATVNLSGLSKTYNGSPQGVAVNTTPTGLNVNVTYEGNAQAPTNAGNYAVVATVNDANYEGRATDTLSIAKASQTITFAPLANKILGAPAFDVSAQGGASGNPVTFAAAGSCTISGNIVSVTGVGSCTITASQAGNGNYEAATPVSRSFNTIYNFAGFRAPVDNGGVYNVAKAGSGIPMKFSLSGNQGLGIIETGFPKATAVTCPASLTTDTLEEVTTSNSGLTYDATADQYNYVWKTQSTYAGKCIRFDMKLIDGTTQSALFKFTK